MAKLNYEGLVDNKLYHTIEYAHKHDISLADLIDMFQMNASIVYHPIREQEDQDDEQD